jgi:antitoxin CptB
VSSAGGGIELRRRRLRFRSAHRGSKELDLILGRFAARYLDGFDGAQLEQYEQLLEMSDPELYNWLAGRAPVPDAARSDVLDLLLAFDASQTTP